MADVSQIRLPNGDTFDLIDEKSGYITAQYIENKTDYSIPVSRVGEIVVGETAIGTDSTNFPTSKAVVDYVDERVVQEMDAIDVGVSSVNGKTGSVTLSASDVGAITRSDLNNELDDFADDMQGQIPTSTSQLTNDSGFITVSDVSTNETDPTVPAWAKASTKPTYTAAEVGAMSTSHAANGITTAKINAWDAKSDFSGSYNDLTDKPTIPTVPTNISAFTNDSGYLTSYTETDPTVPSWAKQSSKPTYTAAEVGALPDSTVIPSKTSDLTNDSGFITSDSDQRVKQTNETASTYAHPVLLGYNVGINETTAQVYKDFANFNYTPSTGNLKATTFNSYTLRAACAKAVDTSISASSSSANLPTSAAVASFVEGKGYLTSYTETDPVFAASAAAGITSTDISNWNAKVSDDKTWNGVTLSQGLTYTAADQYIPVKATNALSGTASQTVATPTPTQYRIAKYDNDACLNSTTPSANNNSTKVATTAYVDAAIPKVYSSTNTGGYLTMATLPIYDGTVE